MKKFNNDKFEINSKSCSLTKINPYYQDKTHYLPYRYKDPSFKVKYNGPLLQKDLYLLNLMNNHFNISSDKFSFKTKTELPLVNSNPIELSSKKDIVFNSEEYYKNQREDKSIDYAFSKLKRKFFYINPVFLKKELINYRKCKFKGTPLYQDKIKYNPKTFLLNFQKQVIENNCTNWEKLKNKHLEIETKRGDKDNKYHDNEKIYEVLGLKVPKSVKRQNNFHSFYKHKTIKLSLNNLNKFKILPDATSYKPYKRRATITFL